jgi:hypothetical protein
MLSVFYFAGVISVSRILALFADVKKCEGITCSTTSVSTLCHSTVLLRLLEKEEGLTVKCDIALVKR